MGVWIGENLGGENGTEERRVEGRLFVNCDKDLRMSEGSIEKKRDIILGVVLMWNPVPVAGVVEKGTEITLCLSEIFLQRDEEETKG